MSHGTHDAPRGELGTKKIGRGQIFQRLKKRGWAAGYCQLPTVV